MTINRLNQGTTNQVLVKAISGQTTNLLELQDSSGNVVSSIGPTGALGGTVSQPQGLVLIDTQTFSAVTSVSFQEKFSSTFANYLIVGEVLGTGTNTLNIRVMSGASAISTSTYNIQDAEHSGATTAASFSGSQTSGRVAQLRAAGKATMSINCYAVNLAETTTFTSISTDHSGSPPLLRRQDTFQSGATAFDGVQFICTNNMSGTLRLYGYRN